MRCFLIIIFVITNLGCSVFRERAIECIDVGKQTICLKRKVWGRNGDKIWITTNKNPCQNESVQTDFITDSLRQGDEILYKIKDNTLYIYKESFSVPKTTFPVKVILEHHQYDPNNPDFDDSKEYQKMNLSIKNTCISDIF